MTWNKIRKDYQERITHYENNIAYHLEQWTVTGNPEHKLFADHDIKQLNEIKNYILKKEKEQGLY
jgi:hypothetical protein